MLIRAHRGLRAAFQVSRSGVAYRVLLVDDHPGFRRMARRLLESGGLVVVGEAGTGVAALSAAIALAPDLVLLDVLLPDTTGVTIADQLAAFDPAPKVILISSRLRSDLAPSLVGARVRGFLQKDELTIQRLLELADD